MSKICYYVLQQDGQWKIKIGGKHYGPYKSRTDAINVAVATANKVGMTHHDGAKVLVEGGYRPLAYRVGVGQRLPSAESLTILVLRLSIPEPPRAAARRRPLNLSSFVAA